MEHRIQFILFSALALALASTVADAAHAANGELEIRAVDKDTGDPVAVRMQIHNARGKTVIPRGTVAWKDHFVFAGNVVLSLPPGDYRFEVQRGPEYRIVTGTFQLKSGDRDNKQITMERFVTMRDEGWWSGELHVHRPLQDIKLLMLAEDLHVAPVITWWNKTNAWADQPIPDKLVTPFDDQRFYSIMAGEDERGGGALLYFGLSEPLQISTAEREYPASVTPLQLARQQPGVHVDAEKPFWWDLPLWLSTGQIDSIGIAHNHMWPHGVLANEAWGKPRDKLLYPDPHGNGRWSQDIYYHVLNCGLRIPPSAGSASGVLPNPVGYNRIYAYVDGELTYEKWWEAVRAGRTVVTNGPLLRPMIQGHPPGHVFAAPAGETVELQMDLNLALREKVEYLELVQNGKVVHEVRLSEYAQKAGQLPAVRFTESGWMLVRVVTENADTYRFASSAPYYVEIGGKPSISRKSAEFFRDWVLERARNLKLDDPQQRAEVLALWKQAHEFWQQKVDAATY